MRGRPLAFVAFAVAGWMSARAWVLFPENVARPLMRVSREALAVRPAAAATTPVHAAPPVRAWQAIERATSVRPSASRLIAAPGKPIRLSVAGGTAPASIAAVTAMPSSIAAPERAPLGLPPIAAPSGASRWSGSAWAIARDGSGAALLSPLLGGAQAGVRIAYRLDDDARVALFARAAAPLRNGPAELAGGVQLRPTRAAITVFAEVRATRGTIAPAAGVFGGGAAALGAGLRLEGYGQAGIIRRDGVSGFGDGQLKVVRPMGQVELGVGAWVAAQRGASRLDIGPSLALPVAFKPLAVRVTLDWRHRVAGNARPASGPAVSLGADF